LIDNAEPITEEDIVEKQELLKHGFGNWTKKDFAAFVKACEKSGRYEILTRIFDKILLGTLMKLSLLILKQRQLKKSRRTLIYFGRGIQRSQVCLQN